MRQIRRDLPSEFVHVTQRGLGRRLIFEDDSDRRHYLSTLKSKSESSVVQILAWTLMPNHVHLLIRSSSDALSKFMQCIGISYAQYFNGRHGHVGKVFQNRYSSEAIEADSHLLSAIRYIHRNAEEAGILDLKSYPWSSYRELSGKTDNLEGRGICNTAITLKLFGGIGEFKSFHDEANERDGFITIGSYKARISDDEARSIAVQKYGDSFSDRISTMSKTERDKALRTLKDLGLSIRQLERLTGIGRGPITRA